MQAARVYKLLLYACITLTVVRGCCPLMPSLQELAKYEIDTHNVVINQIIYPDVGEWNGRLA
jgi:hypothetical protein